jgi:predicted nucleic acid-binding protein
VAIYFFDSSAIVMRYVQHPGTARVRKLADPVAGHFLYLSRIADVELTATFARCRPGRLSADQASKVLGRFRKDLAQDYRVVEVTVPLLHRASLLADAHGLRAGDAIQLSAALVIHSLDPSVIVVSAHPELIAAAAAEGIQTETLSG